MAGISEWTLLVSASFIGVSTVINVVKKGLISCQLGCCKCDFQQIPQTPRSLNDEATPSLFTTRRKQDEEEIEANTSKFEKARNSMKEFNLKKEKLERSKSLN